MSRYTPSPDIVPGCAVSTESVLLPAEADAVAVEQYLIDRGRSNHYHCGERARENACEQGRARKANRQRKAARRAARAA